MALTVLKPRAKGMKDERTSRLAEPEWAALEVLLAGGTFKAAGAAANVAPNSVRRWMTYPQYATFQEEYARGMAALKRQIESRLLGRVDQALGVLDRLLNLDQPIDDAVAEMGQRLKAATWVLDKAVPDGEPAPAAAVQVNVHTGIGERERQLIEAVRVHNPVNAARLEAHFEQAVVGQAEG